MADRPLTKTTTNTTDDRPWEPLNGRLARVGDELRMDRGTMYIRRAVHDPKGSAIVDQNPYEMIETGLSLLRQQDTDRLTYWFKRAQAAEAEVERLFTEAEEA